MLVTPNQSFLVKEQQTTLAACMAAMIHEISNSSPWFPGVWKAAGEVLETPNEWRKDNQVFHFRSNRGASVTFSNARWMPGKSRIDYGDRKVAHKAIVNNPDKTKLIQNKSTSMLSVSYEESESITNSFSTSVTEGMTLDMTVSTETKVSGEYAGVSAEETVTAEFGASKSSEQTRDKSEEGTHSETLKIEFDAEPGQYYLVEVTKEHETVYQDFSCTGIMDFDMVIDFGDKHGGRLEHYYPGRAVSLEGIDGFEQFIHGYDTNYPMMQGFIDKTYSRDRNGFNVILDDGHRALSISGTNQENLENNVDYTVQKLGTDLPDAYKGLPVVDANDLKG